MQDYGRAEPRYDLAALLRLHESDIPTDAVNYSISSDWTPVFVPHVGRVRSIKIDEVSRRSYSFQRCCCVALF